uniref:Coatomer subunit epsilon n=1 Tax=Dunaliella tertiolecta TaxID=3047 RepID=A0A7S3QSH2_DUNTE|mmetsp:Transcript_27203/g.73524  ORF Transcript_27203/g.73524 Transcript_27203/m.73524 type:complete len:289 (+) Transcript_27203:130-996(+)|eukprot:CAMPEP_0202370500 /NCGR_PEP_ID=MMETSP1127-20130417/2100_1 /ASSEMBLY_ACC=CAM_ASM_000462 /TAXON_ID=3047 /ORGANISM="Dunaliella tertiolecta, Strain CCMP1320" /LENGTH=288 /DNA_ID=CAMNT_0048966465 /DNA_START=31 /DNA_END=897 /DNA_ORIENTATION=-
MADPLFAVRNSFYLGAYNLVVQEASELEDLPHAAAIERDTYLYRAYIALGSHQLVISEINESSATSLQAIKLLAEYLSGSKSKEDVFATVGEWLADVTSNRNPTVVLVAGLLYTYEENYVEALKVCRSNLSLEIAALAVLVYLKMDRVDKAEQAVKAMSQMDDDATLTQQATAWVNVALGGSMVQDASYIYQELGDKYNWTATLRNGRAVCFMKMGQWEDAEADLLDAFNKDAKDADTLANLVTVGLHLSKNVARYSSQLKVLAPNHPIVKRLEAGEEAFQQAAASMA